MDRGDFLLGVGTVAGAFLFSLLMDLLRSQIERRQRRNDQRESFQRDTLLALQEGLYLLRVKTGDVITSLNSNRVTRQTPEEYQAYLDRTASNYLDALIKVRTLAVRADDAAVRNDIRDLRTAIQDIITSELPIDDAGKEMHYIMDLHDALDDRIGELLRGDAKPDRSKTA